MWELYLSRSGRLAWDAVPWADGFVFAGPFEDFLRRISEEHLAEVWAGLAACLRSHDLVTAGVTWGGGHPTYTGSQGPVDVDSPLGYFGWILPAARGAGDSLLWQREPYALTVLGEEMEAELLRRELPVTIATARIRSYAVRRVIDGVDLAPLSPDDTATGLEAVVEHCVDSPPDWTHSDYTHWLDGDHACARLYRAMATRDSGRFFSALEEARRTYSPAGYQIVVMGFAANLLGWPPDDILGLVPRAAIPPIVAELGDRLSLEIAEDALRRPEWAVALLRVDGVGGRYERVYRSRLSDFQRDLAAVVSGAEDAATLTSLAGAAEIVVQRGSIAGRFESHPDDVRGEFSRPFSADALFGLLHALERFASESPQPPLASPLPRWGFRGAPKNAEQLGEMMTILIDDQKPS